MLLAGLPRLVKVNVRGSSAGAWLETSVRYALAEARSPRPGGAGVLAKLSEVLFIEVLRLYMNEQRDGDTGWLAGVRDRVVGAALNSLHERPAQAVGYQTDTAFSRAFRREFGAPPAAWRRNRTLQKTTTL